MCVQITCNEIQGFELGTYRLNRHCLTSQPQAHIVGVVNKKGGSKENQDKQDNFRKEDSPLLSAKVFKKENNFVNRLSTVIWCGTDHLTLSQTTNSKLKEFADDNFKFV